jgi:DNA repair protein RecO (recombination protein O)
MISTTQSIVLRATRYGETSLISGQFTRTFGVQSFMVQGVRSASGKGRSSRAGLLQPGMVLDITIYQKPGANLQRLKEFSPVIIYGTVHDDVLKNSVALFSVEVLLRLLPEAAPLPELFDFAKEYLQALDRTPAGSIGNFPLYFALECSRHLGYELIGNYSEETPYLNLAEGGFSAQPPREGTKVTSEDAAALAQLMPVERFDQLGLIALNGESRQRLLEWFLEFLARHTDHMGQVRSLAVLHAILH